MSDRFRFEVRLVDESKRAYVFVDDYPKYHDACIAADVGRSQRGQHFVVWDSKTRALLYDSRKLVAKDLPSNIHITAGD